jgi:hypothetical protein
MRPKIAVRAANSAEASAKVFQPGFIVPPSRGPDGCQPKKSQ